MPCAGTVSDFLEEDIFHDDTVSEIVLHEDSHCHNVGCISHRLLPHSITNAAKDKFSDSYAVPHFQPRLPLKPTHLHLDLNFDIPAKRLTALARHTLQAQCLDADTITLNAEDFLSLSVTCDNDPGLNFSYDGHSVDIKLSTVIHMGDSVVLDVRYVIDDPIDGLLFSRPRDGFFVVSDHETERARYWLPLVDHPVVRTTISFLIRTPVDHNVIALANGSLVSEKIEDNLVVSSWKMDQPTPSYLLCVAIGRFVRKDIGHYNGKHVSLFAAAEARVPYTDEHLSLTFGRTLDMIHFMEKKVGIDLPWPKYYQWAVGEVSGAMENSSLVSYDEFYLIDNRSAAERSHRVDSTVVHELAHSWFGNMVVCADFCHSFLKESFATLISAEWYHHRNGVDDMHYTLSTYQNSAVAEAAEYVRPIVMRKYDSSWSLFDSHLYTNGAWRLHMLRHKLGDEQFWGAVTFYLNKRKWMTVETDDFRRDLEEFTGEELTSYFEQWFYSKGHPVLEASFSYNSKDGFASVGVKQVQVDERRGVGLFDLKVEVAMEMTPGVWETHVLTMVNRTANAQTMVKAGTKPLQVVIDPEMKVLHVLSKFSGVYDDMSLRSLGNALTFSGRWQAVRLLRESGSKRGREALCEALSKEKHWGLRSIIANCLGKTQREEIVPVLRKAITEEKDARVLVAIVTALEDFVGEETEEVLLNFVKEGEEMGRGYGAMAAAFKGIGRQGKTEHIALLRSFIEDESVRKGGTFEMAQGAASGLGLIRDWEATETLMEIIEQGADGRYTGRLRAAMVSALVTAVMWEGKARRMRVFDFVDRLCRQNGSKLVRMACGMVVASLADAGNWMRVLDALENSVSNQSKPLVRNYRKRATRVAANQGIGVKEMTGGLNMAMRELRELRTKVEDLQTEVEAKKVLGMEAKKVLGMEAKKVLGMEAKKVLGMEAKEGIKEDDE